MKPNAELAKGTGVSWLALCASTGTLVCCALPIALVSVGFGAAVAAFTSSLPWLVGLSQHKDWIFAGSGALLAGAVWFARRQARSCPADTVVGALCRRAQAWNHRLLVLTAAVWACGFFFAYLFLPLRIWLDA